MGDLNWGRLLLIAAIAAVVIVIVWNFIGGNASPYGKGGVPKGSGPTGGGIVLTIPK